MRALPPMFCDVKNEPAEGQTARHSRFVLKRGPSRTAVQTRIARASRLWKTAPPFSKLAT